MKPLWHFDRRAPNTPKRPFANVETQLKVPDPAIAAANVIAPLSGFTDALEVKPLPAAVAPGPGAPGPDPDPDPVSPPPNVAAATAAEGPTTVTECVDAASRPLLSVTVSLTGYVPGTLNVCSGATPLADPPSPKFHSYAEIEPSASDEAEPLKATALPAVAVLGENENSAVGTSSTSTRCVAVAICPELSLTRSVTAYVPATANACEEETPDAPEEPSPKFH